jgi:hypothetical protein
MRVVFEAQGIPPEAGHPMPGFLEPAGAGRAMNAPLIPGCIPG